MKTLHFYLLRQVVASLIMTVAVFTFVLLLGNVLKEVLVLLVSGRASGFLVFKAIGMLIPFVWVFALPMGMLTATLLTFGRFSADQELTAARAGGISLISLISPILVLAVLLSALSAWVTMDLGPRSRVAYKAMLRQALMEATTTQLPEGRFIKDFKDKIFYIGKNNDGDLRDVMVFLLEGGTNITTTVRAPRGSLTSDAENLVIHVKLLNAKSVFIRDGRAYAGPGGDWELDLDLKQNLPKDEETDISDMTFLQLQTELQNLEERVIYPKEAATASPQELRQLEAALARQQAELTSPIRFQMNWQLSFSFACIGFTLVGIPLGIRVHRRETNVGVAMALILVLAYYSFFILAQSFETRPEFAPHLVVWIPNFLFQVVGGVLLWRANRGI